MLMYFRWKPYVPVAARREKAAKTAAKLAKKGHALSPVTASRGAIAKSFWGKAWCENLERYSDYANRLPRGRTYLRNGSVIDLKIGAGEATAQVMGSSLYRIKVEIAAVASIHWQGIARDCARSIDTLVELLQGQLSASVMERITRPGSGLFPSPKEIRFQLQLPGFGRDVQAHRRDALWHRCATRCGAASPVRIAQGGCEGTHRAGGRGRSAAQKAPRAGRILDSSKLADVFGIDLADADPARLAKSAAKSRKVPAPRKAKAATRVGARPASKKTSKAR